MKQSLVILLIGLLFVCSPPAAQTQWVQTSGPKGWEIQSIASVGPTLYAATRWAGAVFSSTDGGSSWKSSGSGIRSTWNGLKWLRALGTTLFAASDLGVFRSTDGGSAWTPVVDGLPLPMSGWYSPKDLAILGSRAFLSLGDGVYESTDNGEHWHFSTPEAPDAITYSDVRVFAAIDTVLFLGGRQGIFRTSLNSTDWTPLHLGVPDTVVENVASAGKTVLAAARARRYTGKVRILRSSDGGASWVYAENGLPDTLRGLLTCIESDLYQDVGPAIYRSSDEGENWSLIADTLGGIWGANGIRYAQRSFANDTLLRSTDHGITWAPLSGPQIGTLISAIAGKGDRIVAATWNDEWDYASTDRGNSWSRMSKERVNLNINAVAFCSQYLIAAGTSGDGGIDISSDDGQTWQRVTPATDAQIEYLAVDSPYVYASGGGGMWVSTDCGFSWATRNAGLRSPAPYLGAMAILDSRLFVAEYWSDSVFVSSDHGLSWKPAGKAGPGLPGSINILCMRGESGHLLAGTARSGIWRSSDEGQTWGPSSVGLGDSVINDLASAHGTIFAATQDNGVVASSDAGVNWEPIQDGLATPCVNRLLVHGDDIYAGTANAGVWRRPLSEVTGVGTESYTGPGVVQLWQNYPNPFNPATTIRFNIGGIVALSGAPLSGVEGRTSVKLAIYDLLGREVAVLVNERKAPGRYEVRFDSGGRASGVYIYRLTTESSVESRKMLLVR